MTRIALIGAVYLLVTPGLGFCGGMEDKPNSNFYAGVSAGSINFNNANSKVIAQTRELGTILGSRSSDYAEAMVNSVDGYLNLRNSFATIGGQLGYNYIPKNRLFLGFEFAADYVDAENRINKTGLNTMTFSGFTNAADIILSDINYDQTVNGLFAFTLKPGINFTNAFHFFANVALVGANVDSHIQITQSQRPQGVAEENWVSSGSYSKTEWGYGVGFGANYNVSQSVFISVNYLYFDCGAAQYNASDLVASRTTDDALFASIGISTFSPIRGSVLKVGVNYQFLGV